MTTRTLRNRITGATIDFDLSNVSHLLQHNIALETGLWTDDSELSESIPTSEDELRAEMATLRSEYEALEQRQDEIQLRIRALAKMLPEDELLKSIPCPY